MTREPIGLDALLEARGALHTCIAQLITEADKRFLLSVKQGDPEWDLLPIANVSELPAVRWKLRNIRRMQKDRHLAAIGKLERVLEHL